MIYSFIYLFSQAATSTLSHISISDKIIDQPVTECILITRRGQHIDLQQQAHRTRLARLRSLVDK